MTTLIERKEAIPLKICLVNPPSTSGITPVMESPYPPHGLLCLAAYLEKEGYKVKVWIIDCMIDELSHEDLGGKLRRLSPDEVGITMHSAFRHSGLKCAEVAKRIDKNILTVVGGVHVTHLDDEVLNRYPDVDVVIRGEGELTFAELLNKDDRNDVSGISYRENGEVVRNKERERIKDIDCLPFPAYHLVPMEKYFAFAKRYQSHLRNPASMLMTSRGCMAKCAFCAVPNTWLLGNLS